MSALRALKKLRAGAGQDMDDAERDTLVKDLKKARDKLKEGKLAKSEMIVKSCRQAGLHTMPESNGILDAILAKGSHKNMVRTVAYDPVSKQLKTCVTKDTYDAANEFIQKGGIEAFRSASGDLMSVLLDFNTVWNETEKLIQPYVVGTHYKKADALKNEKGKTIEVEGADGHNHPINTCEASATEQECYARRTSLAGKAGDACVWMPNFAHLDDQIVNSSVIGEDKWRELQSQVCVHQGDIPLPMRDATQVDQTALRSGRQLKVDPNRAMGSSGRMLKLNAKAYEKPRKLPTKGTNADNVEYTAIVPNNVFQLRYPQFSIVTPFGMTKKMPYVFKRVKGNNGKVELKTKYNGDADDDATKIERWWLKRSQKNLSAKIKVKLNHVSSVSREIREEVLERLATQYNDQKAYKEAVAEELKQNPKYVSVTDQLDYSVYHAAKEGTLKQNDVNMLMKLGTGGSGRISVVTSDADVSTAWAKLLESSGLEDDEKALVARRLADKNVAREKKDVSIDGGKLLTTKLESEKIYSTKKAETSTLGQLADFLTAGGDTSGAMLPVQMPPRNSAANDRLFVTFNHGPMDLFGGGLMKDSAPGAHVDNDKPYNDFGKITQSEVAADKKIAVAGMPSPGEGIGGKPNLFFLNRFALLLLKADMAKYAPMIHNYYAGIQSKLNLWKKTADKETAAGAKELDAETAALVGAFKSLRGKFSSAPGGVIDPYNNNLAEYNDNSKPNMDNKDTATNVLLISPLETQRDAYDAQPSKLGADDQSSEEMYSGAGGIATRAKFTSRPYKFPTALLSRKLLDALSLERSKAAPKQSLLRYVVGDAKSEMGSAEAVTVVAKMQTLSTEKHWAIDVGLAPSSKWETFAPVELNDLDAAAVGKLLKENLSMTTRRKRALKYLTEEETKRRKAAAAAAAANASAGNTPPANSP